MVERLVDEFVVELVDGRGLRLFAKKVVTRAVWSADSLGIVLALQFGRNEGCIDGLMEGVVDV